MVEVSALGRHLMDQIGRLIPVLPVPLVARVLLAVKDGAALSEMEIKSQVGAQVEQMQARGAHVYVPRSDWDYAVGAGLRMLTLRHLVNESAGLRLMVGSLWMAILAASTLGFLYPRFFAPVLLIQIF